jgi:hypothetical protein
MSELSTSNPPRGESVILGGCRVPVADAVRAALVRRGAVPLVEVPLPYARFNEIRFEELVGLIPPLSYSLPRGDDLFN